jgi:hypothetical protein
MKYNINKQKTYVFDSEGNFLRARPTRIKAILGTNESNCFFFSKEDIKKGRHTKLFNKIKKYKS